MSAGAPSSGMTRRAVLGAGLAAAASALRPASSWGQEPAASEEPAGWTLTQAAAAIAEGTVSPVELVQACLTRIERIDPVLNAYITVRGEAALAEARAAEAEIRTGRRRGPLHGIPIAIKDNIETAGLRTTGGSELLRDHVPEEDAEVVRRLREAGAIVLGKLNLDEFAYGAVGSHYGVIRNPWDPQRATGSTSGGSGVAVAADLCFAALGTDTAGSVRMPAAHCGVVGLKPSFGWVSSRGVYILSWVLDHVGPLCKRVEDAALMLNAMAGHDPREPTTAERPVPDFTRALGTSPQRLRLGIPHSPFFDDLDPEMEAAVTAAVDTLATMTSGSREVELPATPSGARLWGPEAYAFHHPWISTSPERYRPATRANLERYAQADTRDYVEARREVDRLRREVRGVFEDVDLLVTPIMRRPPGLLSEGAGPSANAAVFNVLGLPAVTVPCGFTRSGLPMGVQIVGAPWADATVLALAHAYEQATEWHLRKPPAAA